MKNYLFILFIYGGIENLIMQTVFIRFRFYNLKESINHIILIIQYL